MVSKASEFQVVVVGTGRAGLAIARAFQSTEIPVALVSRSAKRLKKQDPPVFTVGDKKCPKAVGFVLLAVPDRAIPEVAQAMIDAGVVGPKTLVGHLSGALPSTVLSPLIPEKRVFSAHPLTAFSKDWKPLFESGLGYITVMLEAPDEKTAIKAKRLFQDAGGQVYLIERSKKPLYHAAAVVGTSFPFLNLIVCSRLLAECGVPEPVRAAGRLLEDTIENVRAAKDLSGLTGPFIRADVGTIASNLGAIREFSSVIAELYSVQGRILAEMLARQGHIAQDALEQIKKVLA